MKISRAFVRACVFWSVYMRELACKNCVCARTFIVAGNSTLTPPSHPPLSSLGLIWLWHRAGKKKKGGKDGEKGSDKTAGGKEGGGGGKKSGPAGKDARVTSAARSERTDASDLEDPDGGKKASGGRLKDSSILGDWDDPAKIAELALSNRYALNWIFFPFFMTSLVSIIGPNVSCH